MSSEWCRPLFPITLPRGPNSSLRHQGPLWPLISHHIIKGSHLSLHHQGAPISPIAPSKGSMRCVYWLKSYNRDVYKVWVGVYVAEGVKGIRLWSMRRGPGESVVHGPRTSSLRHWAYPGPSRVGNSPTRRTEMRKKISKVWGKIRKIHQNLRKNEESGTLAYPAGPGLWGWQRPCARSIIA